jgi:hypothetical protein
MRSPSFEDREAKISSDPFVGDREGALEQTSTSTNLQFEETIAQPTPLHQQLKTESAEPSY